MKNPSSWNQRIWIAAIALVGAAISLYLGLYQWRMISAPWDPIFKGGTQRVLDSDISHQIIQYIRIPDAILGIFAYFSDAVFAMAGSKDRWRDRPWLVILFGINVIPIGIVSMILVLLQGFAVKYWCFLCLMAALVSISLIPLAYNEVMCTLRYIKILYKETGKQNTWRAFWGDPSAQREDLAKMVFHVAEIR